MRVIVIEPGAVATELADHITHGETKQAIEQFYEATAITADDIAQIIAFAVSRPRSVSLNEILVRPTAAVPLMQRRAFLRLALGAAVGAPTRPSTRGCAARSCSTRDFPRREGPRPLATLCRSRIEAGQEEKEHGLSGNRASSS